MANNKSSGALITLLVGVAGFVAGLLVAPKSGKDTRDDLMKDGKKVADTAKETVETVKAKTAEVKARSQQAVESAKDGFKKAPSKKK